MGKRTKEIVLLHAREVLLVLFEVSLPIIGSNSRYRSGLDKLSQKVTAEQETLARRIYYLKRMGFIETFVEEKERYVEITPKGLKQIQNINDRYPTIPRSEAWDGKWRIVIFDIPDKYNSSRNLFRRRLILMGFEKIQESVYAFPFECTDIIARQSKLLQISGFVLVMISDIIQGESDLIFHFIENGILEKHDIES